MKKKLIYILCNILFSLLYQAEAQDIARYYDVNKLIGSWKLTTVVDLTTCTSEFIGDTSYNLWSAVYKDTFKFKSDSGAVFDATIPYSISSKDKYKTYITNNSNNVIYDLSMDDEKLFSGRAIAHLNNCSTLYSVKLEKIKQNSIRDINWLNITLTTHYDKDKPEKIKIINGEFNNKYEEGKVEAYFGDVTGDGIEDVILAWFAWPTEPATDSWGWIDIYEYNQVSDLPNLISPIKNISSRGEEFLESVYIKSGIVYFKKEIWQDGDPLACGSRMITEEWLFKNNKLTKNKIIKSESNPRCKN